MFEDKHLLEGGRCGSASHWETLSIAVASLCHQITLSQPPYSIHLFHLPLCGFPSSDLPILVMRVQFARLHDTRRINRFFKSSNRLLPADLEYQRRQDARPIPSRNRVLTFKPQHTPSIFTYL